MSTKQLKEATSIGYKSVGRGIKTYLYGWWLQFSRAMIGFGWILSTLLVIGVLSTVHELVAVLAGGVVFFGLPIVWGFYKLRSGDDD